MRDEERTVVVFSGGGTGGHLYPALFLAEALVERRPDVRPVFVGAQRGIEARVLPTRGVEHVLVPALGFERGARLSNWKVVPQLARSRARVAELYQQLRPELVVVTGGYAGAPAGAVAVLRGVPLALQEQNAVPGVTTRWLAPFARQVHVAYPEARERLPARARPKVILSGNPVRLPTAGDRSEARRSLEVPLTGTLVLVVGGSQGSQSLNRAVLEAVAAVTKGDLPLPVDLDLLWSTGPAHLADVRAALREVGLPAWVRTVGYLEHMELALAAADLAVSRAGAMATSEFLAWGLPSLLVPLPTAAADHQTANAKSLESMGAAVHLPEANLDGPRLWGAVLDAVSDPARLLERRRAALSRGRPDAARQIAAALDALLPPASGGSSVAASPTTDALRRPGAGA